MRSQQLSPEVYASHEGRSRPVSSTLVFDTSNHFDTSTNRTPEWWKIDFKKNVYITNYLIKSYPAAANNGWLYNLSIFASTNNRYYKKVHGPIQDANAEKAYKLNHPVIARYIRLDGNSLFSNDPTCMAFYYVKFFGSLNAVIESYDYRKRANKNLIVNLILSFILIST